MKLFSCSKCCKSFKSKQNLIYHLEKAKTKCDEKSVKYVDGKKKYLCKYCDKQYSRLSYLRKHKETIHSGINEISELKKEMQSLKEQISNSLTINNNTINNTNNIVNDNSQVININVTVNPIHKEDLSHIDEQTWLKSIKSPFNWIPRLIKLINFSEQAPQNHNIFLLNQKNKLYKIFMGNNEFIIRDANDLVYSLIDIQTDRINNKAIELKKRDGDLDKKLGKIENDIKTPKTPIFKIGENTLLSGGLDLKTIMKNNNVEYDYSTSKKTQII